MDLSYLDKITQNTPIEVIDRVARDAETYKHDPDIIQLILEAIWLLGINSKNQPTLLEYKVEDIITESFHDHANHPQVLLLALTAIPSIEVNSYDFVIRKRMGSLIKQVMKRFPDNAKLQEHACDSIQSLTGTNQRVAEEFMEINIHFQILEAMREHKSSHKLQIAATRAVFSLAASEDLRRNLWNRGLCHFIIQAMNKFPLNEELQEIGIQTIAIFDFPYCNARLFAHETVLKAIKRFASNVKIISGGCRFLRYLGEISGNIPSLIQLNSVALMIYALEEFPKKKFLQEAGCKAIWTLATYEATKDDVMEQGIVDYLNKLIKRYRKYQEVIFPAMGCVGSLANKPYRASLILDSDIPAYMINAAKYHIKNERVQVTVVNAFKNFSLYWNEEQKDRTLKHGFDKLLEEILNRYQNNSTMRKRGNEILDRLK